MIMEATDRRSIGWRKMWEIIEEGNDK